MDEIMERSAQEGETLGWFDWILPKRKPKPKPKSVSSQYAALQREIKTMLANLHKKKARLRQLRSRMKTASRRTTSRSQRAQHAASAAQVMRDTTARFRARVQQQVARSRLTTAERRELARRMRWGWAQRPGAPDMPGEAAAKIRSYAKYKRDLQKKITARLIRERNMGWAKRPGAPDMPGEAAAKMRKAGVLGDDTLEMLDEEIIF